MKDYYYGYYQGVHCIQPTIRGKQPHILRDKDIKNVHKYNLKDFIPSNYSDYDNQRI